MKYSGGIDRDNSTRISRALFRPIGRRAKSYIREIKRACVFLQKLLFLPRRSICQSAMHAYLLTFATHFPPATLKLSIFQLGGSTRVRKFYRLSIRLQPLIDMLKESDSGLVPFPILPPTSSSLSITSRLAINSRSCDMRDIIERFLRVLIKNAPLLSRESVYAHCAYDNMYKYSRRDISRVVLVSD